MGTGKRHTDRDYEAQLRELRARLLDMTTRVVEMISASMLALVGRDGELARRTIERDHAVNHAELEADGLCMLILARRQPMASDLRFITRALKMVTDLERIGDLAVNICERAVDLEALPPLKPYRDIPRMAEVAQGMIRDAIEAFVSGDSERAAAVIARDDEVDRLYESVYLEILALMRGQESILEAGIHVQSVAKYLERIADHATNLAEEVIYLLQGRDVRHRGKLDPHRGPPDPS